MLFIFRYNDNDNDNYHCSEFMWITFYYQDCIYYVSFLGQNLRWNQTGVIIAGTGGSGSSSKQFSSPECIYIDANDTLYICDHFNDRIQMWTKGAVNGLTVVDASLQGDHPVALTFDKNGYLYISSHNNERVLRYNPDFTNSTTVAGQNGVTSTALDALNYPIGVDVDENLNLYIADSRNRRVMKWEPNATSGTIVVGGASTPRFHGLLLSPYSSDAVYLSSETDDSVYLWTFGASAPSVTLTSVNSTTSSLNRPSGIKHDLYGNLYVADQGNERVVMYCANTTLGKVVVGDTGSTPALNKPIDVGLDSNLNLYVVDERDDIVVKYARL